MGKISKICYEEIPTKGCTVTEAAEFYFYANLIGSHELFHDDYEKYEMDQINLKNKTLGEVVKRSDGKERPKVGSSVLAISSLKNKVVIIADVY